jgi:hypothetical protein
MANSKKAPAFGKRAPATLQQCEKAPFVGEDGGPFCQIKARSG